MTVPDAGADGESGESGELTIQQAAETLDVPAPTIRSWERRYGVPVADRSSGGHRRYTSDQLDRLRSMRDLIARGRRPGEAAALVKAGHSVAPGPLVEAFLQGSRDLASDRITRILEIAGETLGLDRTVDEVLMPAMRQIGELWHAGRLDIAHEHLAANATQVWLAAFAPPGALRPERPIVLSCGPLDHHTLGLEAIGALLRQRLWDCRMLGARTPVDSLVQAVEATDAAAVVVTCQITAGRLAAVEALRMVERTGAQLFYAGGAFAARRARDGVPGRYLGTSLGQAADLMTDALTGTRR
jgi:DNA-binding transcriptional MerR regulator/methylmalonyl-CoA mutase cobalamin-binding subunit